MAGGRGRGRRGQVPDEEVHHQDRSVQDVMIEDLQRQVAELTRRLAVQEIDDREEEGLASESSLENPYHHPYHHQSYHPHPFHREYRGREESQWSLSFWVDLPEFAGTLHAEGFIDWLDEVEEIFEYNEVPDHIKVKLIALKLKGRASAWWEQLKRSRERQGKDKIKDWEKMKKKMKGHFLPFRYRQTPFQRLHSLKQDMKSIDDYTTKSHRTRHLLQDEMEEVFEEIGDPIYDVEEDIEENFEMIGEPIYDVYDDEEDGNMLCDDEKTTSICDTIIFEGWIDGNTVDAASDCYQKHKDNIKLVSYTGVEAYKIFISWPRFLLNRIESVNPKGMNYYNNELIKYGIQPHVTLYHLDVPQVLQDEYEGGLSAKIIDDDVCFKKFDDKVSYWTILNEPIISVFAFIDYELFSPRRCSYPYGVNCMGGNSIAESYQLHGYFPLHLTCYSSNTALRDMSSNIVAADVSLNLSAEMQQFLDKFFEFIPEDLPPGLPPEEHIFNMKHLSHYFRDPDETTVNSKASSFQPGATDAGAFWSNILRWRIGSKKGERYSYFRNWGQFWHAFVFMA